MSRKIVLVAVFSRRAKSQAVRAFGGRAAKEVAVLLPMGRRWSSRPTNSNSSAPCVQARLKRRPAADGPLHVDMAR